MNIVKSIIILLLCILPTLLTAQIAMPSAGIWGGELIYKNQTTEFYLEISPDNNGNMIAKTYMPVIPFPKRTIGVITEIGDYFESGPIRFTMNNETLMIVGTFPGSSRALHFELRPIDDFPIVEPLKSHSNATPVWTFTTNSAIWAGATADQNNIYIGSTNGNMYSLSQSDGSQNWKYETNGRIFSRPLIHDAAVYFLSDVGYLFKINSETGSLLWSFDTGGGSWERRLPTDEIPGWDTATSGVAIYGNTVFVGSADGHFFAIHLDKGTEKWRFKTDGPIHSVPVIEENIVVFGSYDRNVYALNVETGELIWKFNTGQMIVSSPVLANGLVIIGSRSADLYALDVHTGTEVWSYFHWGSWIESSGTIFEGHLYIGSSDDQLLKSFNPNNGDLLWSTNLGGSPWSTPAVSHNTVFSGTLGNANYDIDHRGGFFAVDRLTGHIIWNYMWEKKSDTSIYGVVSSPVVANGMVFFGGLDGVVYGFNVDNN